MTATLVEAVTRRRILAGDMARNSAVVNGVCCRPLVAFVSNEQTGDRRRVPIPCGSTREDRCPACADRARRLRIHQCREGWHRTTEPLTADDLAELGAGHGWYDLPGAWTPLDADDDLDDDVDGLEGGEGQGLEDAGVGGGGPLPVRRVRSTRRRPDVPDLPKVPMADHTLGRIFRGRDGKAWRPSMFITLTMPSYGPVDLEGCPRDPDSYDYRRAALDAMHFAKLVDRFWQNLRRCCGYNAQYFATIESQRRLAPHLHAAIRGAIPRRVFHQVVDATYHQLWWPPHDEPVYDGQLPHWNEAQGGYVDPTTSELLPTWDHALDDLDADPEAGPAHVLRFGGQANCQGLIPGKVETDRTVGYLTKYLTKTVAAAWDDDQDDDEEERSARRQAHLDRLADEVRWLPCSERCANWLRYGTQPKDAGPGLAPGFCRGKAHRRENLGLGGRRVLVSRRWTGKTLDGHRADRAGIVRAALTEAGIPIDDHTELSATGTAGPWRWHIPNRSQLDPETYAEAIGDLIETRSRWRSQYQTAKARAGPAEAPAKALLNSGGDGVAPTMQRHDVLSATRDKEEDDEQFRNLVDTVVAARPRRRHPR